MIYRHRLYIIMPILLSTVFGCSDYRKIAGEYWAGDSCLVLKVDGQFSYTYQSEVIEGTYKLKNNLIILSYLDYDGIIHLRKFKLNNGNLIDLDESLGSNNISLIYSKKEGE